MTVLPVIIAGGAGKRLWPMSTPERPKPFIDLLGDGANLFRRTLERARLVSRLKPLVICNWQHRELVIGHDVDVLFEPAQRDTAPAICAAALHAATLHGKDVTLAVMPADHLVHDASGFAETVQRAAGAASNGAIVTVAITPTRPAPEFGYLNVAAEGRDGICTVRAFVEKPNTTRAAELIADGHYWNGGMFISRAEALVEAFAVHAPGILESCRKALLRAEKNTLDEPSFATADKVSFDYAVMEKHPRVAAVKAAFDWEDLGNWNAVWSASRKDSQGNFSTGQVELRGTSDCYVRCEQAKIISYGCNHLLFAEAHGQALMMPLKAASLLKPEHVTPATTLAHKEQVEMTLPWNDGMLRIENPGPRPLAIWTFAWTSEGEAAPI